ncbi:MAG: type IV toxin-antitoxin system AbiEi family antitoxin domain-containing protein [Actinobacteria bacterium]|nr:type IV toxin-antitoxin system AbiEi family antitoxin domain-containing protein [Actinomycetota bacterium]
MPTHTLKGAVGELAASHHGAFSRRQAASIGVSTRHLVRLVDQRVLTEPAPGVYALLGTPLTWRHRLAVATLCSNEAGAAAYESSAQLHAFDGYTDDAVTVLLPSPRRLRLEGVSVHVGPMDPVDLTVIDGIRCTTVERTLCDLGSVSSPFMVKLAFEWYWRTCSDLSVLQQTVDRLHRPGQRGTRAIQDLIVESRLHGRPTESGLEVRLEAIIGDIPGLVRQHEVFDESGQFVARVDFAIPSLRLAFEAHSEQFHSGPDAQERDLRRHARLTDADWRTRYITSKEMLNPLGLRAEVQRLLGSSESPALPTW